MAIYSEGPTGVALDWNLLQIVLTQMAAVKEDKFIGASVQKFGDRLSAMEDQFAGKLGPAIAKWNPEKGNRMIQEF